MGNERIDIGPYEYSGASAGHYEVAAPFAKLIGNPLNGQSRVVLNLERASEAVVTVYSLAGSWVARKTFCLEGSDGLGIGGLAEHLAPGLYLIEVAVDGKVCTLKAVK